MVSGLWALNGFKQPTHYSSAMLRCKSLIMMTVTALFCSTDKPDQIQTKN
jgi:hypothetical protein